MYYWYRTVLNGNIWLGAGAEIRGKGEAVNKYFRLRNPGFFKGTGNPETLF